MSENTAKPRRRFLRFSLRGLLLLVLFIGAALAVTIKAREQGTAVAALKDAGFEVSYVADGSGPLTTSEWLRKLFATGNPRTVVAIRCNIFRERWYSQEPDPHFADNVLVHLRALTELKTVAFDRRDVTDHSLVYIQGLNQIEILTLGGTAVSDVGMTHLQGLSKLTYLDISDTSVAGPGLVHLRGLPNLLQLDLDGTQLTDAGASHLRGLTVLRGLKVNRTQLTDAGMVYLEGLPNLAIVDVSDTRVTEAGVQRLRRAAPKLKVIHGKLSRAVDSDREGGRIE